MGSEGFYNSQFVQTLSTPTIVSTSASPSSSLTPPPTVDPATTIKMEDLNMPYSTPAPPSLPPTSECGTPTPQSSSDSKPVKKRKSWGQVLPEPKTNLPPRKRAKTEDEKEQRRIERVKRNRLAAHNSRERKRQEVEQLQSEKDKLEADLQAAHDAMSRMAAELKAYRQKYPSESFSSSAATDDYESLVHKTDTVDPTHTSMSFPSPISMDSMDSPSPRDESCQPETPFSEANADFDQTRYPAAILCDLQCQSISASASRQPSLQAMLAFSFSLQPHPSFDEKPLDDLFAFDMFPENSTNGLGDSQDFLSASGFGTASNPYGLSDPFEGKHFDLQTASGATFVSDEALAAEH